VSTGSLLCRLLQAGKGKNKSPAINPRGKTKKTLSDADIYFGRDLWENPPTFSRRKKKHRPFQVRQPGEEFLGEKVSGNSSYIPPYRGKDLKPGFGFRVKQKERHLICFENKTKRRNQCQRISRVNEDATPRHPEKSEERCANRGGSWSETGGLT